VYVNGTSSVSTFTAKNCQFYNNTANTGNADGGAVMLYGSFVTFTATNCSFTNNTANRVGGAVSNDFSATFIAISCTFSDNKSLRTSGNGGGVLYSNGTSIIANSTFSNNFANSSNGGAMAINGGNAYLFHNTIVKNNAAGGGGIRIASGTLHSHNCIIAGNTGGTNPQVFGTIGTNNLIEGIDGVTFASLFGSATPHADGYFVPLANEIVNGATPLTGSETGITSAIMTALKKDQAKNIRKIDPTTKKISFGAISSVPSYGVYVGGRWIVKKNATLNIGKP